MSAETSLLHILRRNRRRQRILLALTAGLLVAAGLSLLMGRYPTPGLISWSQLASDDLAARLVFGLRLPRLLAALLRHLLEQLGGCRVARAVDALCARPAPHPTAHLASPRGSRSPVRAAGSGP